MPSPKNRYSYLDPINQYTLKNGVLKNLANIEDENVLLIYESLKVSKRLEELYSNPINIIDSSSFIGNPPPLVPRRIRMGRKGKNCKY
jgi:hypothetical protein